MKSLHSGARRGRLGLQTATPACARFTYSSTLPICTFGCDSSGATVRKVVESYFAEITQLPDGTYYVSLTATTIDDEGPQLLNQEIDRRHGVSLDEVLAVIKDGLIGSA